MAIRTPFWQLHHLPGPTRADERIFRRGRRRRRVDYPKLVVWIAIIALPWAAIGYGLSLLSGR